MSKCEKCTLGIRSDGQPCDCSFGRIQLDYLEREALLRAGHGDPIAMDVIPARYRHNDTDSLVNLFGSESSKMNGLSYILDWSGQDWFEQKERSLLLWGPVG